MPLYEYECQECSRRIEVLQRFGDEPKATCDECGGELKKLLSAPMVQFKGSGWYVTDYASKKPESTRSESQSSSTRSEGQSSSNRSESQSNSTESSGGGSSESKTSSSKKSSTKSEKGGAKAASKSD